MIHCVNCKTDLLTDNVLLDRLLRCARCGFDNDPELSDAKLESHRSAWWSVALGAASALALVLAFFLIRWRAPVGAEIACVGSLVVGVTGAYLGLKALLRMRYRKAKAPTKVAAVTGMITGIFFGGLIGSFTAMIGLIILVIANWSQSTDGPEATYPLFRKMAQIDFPEQLKLEPYSGTLAPIGIFGRVEFRDNEKFPESSVWFYFYRFSRWTTTNRAQFTELLSERIYRVRERDGLTETGTAEHQWKICGEQVDVQKVLWDFAPPPAEPSAKSPTNATNEKTANVNEEFAQYYMLVDDQELTFGLVLIHDTQRSNLSEQEIQAIFESLRRRDLETDAP